MNKQLMVQPSSTADTRSPWRGLRELVQLVRLPNLLLLALCMVLVRVGLLHRHMPAASLLDVRFALLLLSTLCVAAAGYIINDYYDVKIDAINRPDRLVVGRAVNRRHAMLAHLLLTGIGMLVSGALSPLLGLVHAASGLLLWGYSVRLKRMALVGNLSIAALTAASVLTPELQLRTGVSTVWVYALAAFLLSVVREIIKDVEDMRGDAEHDCRTLPIVAGVARTQWVAGFFLLLLALLVSGAVWQSVQLGWWWLAAWLLVLVLLPLAALARLLARADRKAHFAQLSLWCKLIMLAGVLSMLVVEVGG
ncbi:geranylgeranylglycerol-phosphate geranylgeranyltransferase [Hymenobacter sp. J193]|uniref:geranylgeranylglycerol-phosphate geranylgeranyltransferase n=1 Tax=Hymenobacter sp. J193 TaxID=2898429 RepID=UPI002150EA85|nr:geranylgeranylglycerol-phosphate geranylgeranyltransferase [Hymenobacter sp. J193]MCR5887403.1 geranylgeranylglycerol-phosphate geranylgeranyltransferase [Hymenobacter sp. J193]